jgi:hypothetical protein
MSDQPTVNRYLKDKAMDHIDHALGRPLDPMGQTYRNYFVVQTETDLAHQFRENPHWHEGGKDGTMSYFTVTQEGRAALHDHLKIIGDPNRGFAVTFRGQTFTVVARSKSAARYDAYLRVSDCDHGLTFGAFLCGSKVHNA